MTEATHCKLWLPKKRRFCANSPLLDSLFCGNHTQRSDAQWIPAPIDPSHSVLEDNLETHLNRCSLLKQTQSLSRQPFYQNGINAGSDDDAREEEKSKSDFGFTSEMKRNAVYSMDEITDRELMKLQNDRELSKQNCPAMEINEDLRRLQEED
ncbi:tRNA:m(4)X modification enzyme TRM13-like [Salvia splendens]|uniref:tRNA:m(4)X modification enzyme TRM13-like n=1 Tax=Salvia splendens TaxID=180675 RepID=UPI001C279236|nr:tRNA:m(4)X modification enzyme TRM13-like [Salvia splendens]